MANRAVHFLAPLVFGAVLEFGGFGLAFGLSGLAVGVAAIYLLRFLRRQGTDNPA